MSRKRTSEPDPVREELLQACRQVAAAGGVVLVGSTGKPFAFYPPRAVVEPAAPGRLREVLNRRVGEEGAR